MNAHNSEEFVRESIQSVVDQSWTNWELILWDNASQDSTHDILMAFNDKRMKYFATPVKVSLYESRVNAVRASEGALVAFLDCDDIWVPEKLQRQAAVFADPQCVASCSDYIAFDVRIAGDRRPDPSIFHTYLSPVTTTTALIADYRVGMSTLVVRRDAALRSWDAEPPPYSMIEDFDMVVRLVAGGSLVPVPEPLMWYRLHANNFSWRSTTAILEWTHWLENIDSLALDPTYRDEVELSISHKIAGLEAREALRTGQGVQARCSIRLMEHSSKRFKYWVASWLPPKLMIHLAS
jgi:glycosyltransferase involved in cell wall biosynthesis